MYGTGTDSGHHPGVPRITGSAFGTGRCRHLGTSGQRSGFVRPTQFAARSARGRCPLRGLRCAASAHPDEYRAGELSLPASEASIEPEHAHGGAGSSAPDHPARRIPRPARRAWPAVERTLRWLRKPFHDIEGAYRQAIVLTPNEPGFMKEVEEVWEPRRPAHGRRRRPRARDSGHSGLRTLPMRPSTGDTVASRKAFGSGEYRCWPSAAGRTSALSR